MTAAWSRGVLYLRAIVCTDERGIWHLEIAPKDEPDLCRCAIVFSEVLADLF